MRTKDSILKVHCNYLVVPDKFVLPYCKMGRKINTKKVATPGSGVSLN